MVNALEAQIKLSIRWACESQFGLWGTLMPTATLSPDHSIITLRSLLFFTLALHRKAQNPWFCPPGSCTWSLSSSCGSSFNFMSDTARPTVAPIVVSHPLSAASAPPAADAAPPTVAPVVASNPLRLLSLHHQLLTLLVQMLPQLLLLTYFSPSACCLCTTSC